MQVHDVNPIEKILAKSAGFDFFLQPAICGADYAHFNFLVFLSADAAELPILKQLQHFRLKRKIQFGSLIAKKTGAMGQFDASRFELVGAVQGACSGPDQHTMTGCTPRAKPTACLAEATISAVTGYILAAYRNSAESLLVAKRE